MDYVKEWNKFVNQFSRASNLPQMQEVRKEFRKQTNVTIKRSRYRNADNLEVSHDFVILSAHINDFIRDSIRVAFPKKYEYIFEKDDIRSIACTCSERYRELIPSIYINVLERFVSENKKSISMRDMKKCDSVVLVNNTILGSDIQTKWKYYHKLQRDPASLSFIFSSDDSLKNVGVGCIDVNETFCARLSAEWAVTHRFKIPTLGDATEIPFEFMYMCFVFRQYCHDDIVENCLERGASVGSKLYEAGNNYELVVAKHPFCLRFELSE